MMRFRYILIVGFLAYLATGFAQVRPEERAVVRRFGQVVARPGPGLWVGLPWGIDRVDRVPVRTVRQIKAGFVADGAIDAPGNPVGQLLTGDQNLVNVQLTLDYAIGETDADLDGFVIHQDQVDAILAREAEAATAEWAGGRTVDEALLAGTAALPAWIMERLEPRIHDLNLGVRVQRVAAVLAPPEEVRAAFEQVSQAQTGIRTREHQARQEADQRLRQGEALRYKWLQEAEAFKAGQLQQAKADATEFTLQLDAFRELKKTDPDALTSLWWNELQKTLIGWKNRGGRIEPLDAHLGKDGLDITQFVNPKRR
jgi:membrane protease subunit HflK